MAVEERMSELGEGRASVTVSVAKVTDHLFLEAAILRISLPIRRSMVPRSAAAPSATPIGVGVGGPATGNGQPGTPPHRHAIRLSTSSIAPSTTHP